MDRLTRTKLRLYGGLPREGDLIDAIASGDAAVGTAGRWTVVSPPAEPLSSEHRIAQLKAMNAEEAVALRYEIMGWAVLAPAAGTLLFDEQYSLNLRQGLIHHFYLSGTPDWTAAGSELLASIDATYTRVCDSLGDLHLRPRSGSVVIDSSELTEDQQVDLCRGLCADHALLAASRHETADVFLLERQGCRLVITLSRPSGHQLDDLAWYRDWLGNEGLRTVLSHGQDLARSAPHHLAPLEMLSEVASNHRQHLNRVLDTRRDFLQFEDRLRELRLMSTTARSYRANTGDDHIRLLAAPVSEVAPAISEFLPRERRRLVEEPVAVLIETLETATREAEVRVATLSEISNLRYNSSVQGQLSRLQWLTALLGLATLLVALVTGLKGGTHPTVIVRPATPATTTTRQPPTTIPPPTPSTSGQTVGKPGD